MKRFFHWIIKDKKRAVRLAIIWTALIFIATLIPSSGVPKVKIPMMDKWVHFIIFAGFSFLWAATIERIKPYHYFLIFALSVAVGWVVELLQGSGITSSRSYEVDDIIADAIGGFLGVIIFYFSQKLIMKKNS